MAGVFKLFFTEEAQKQLIALATPALKKRYKAVVKSLKFLAVNPRHPGLKTHEFTSLKGPNGEKVFEAYAEQNTPAAYRIFWIYGPNKDNITVITITPHP